MLRMPGEAAATIDLKSLPAEVTALIERLQQGKVYVPEQAAHALQAFFSPSNLTALRELALRRMAQRVDSDVQAYRREHGIATLWPAGERLLVCVGPSPSGARLVRAAARIAASLRAEWIAVNVETPALALAGAAERDQLASSLRLAESLGAEVVVLVDEAVADALLRLARERNVSRIVVGHDVGVDGRRDLVHLGHRLGNGRLLVVARRLRARQRPEAPHREARRRARARRGHRSSS